jgi:hypothetical protein
MQLEETIKQLEVKFNSSYPLEAYQLRQIGYNPKGMYADLHLWKKEPTSVALMIQLPTTPITYKLYLKSREVNNAL